MTLLYPLTLESIHVFVDGLIIAPLLCFLDMLNGSLSLCSFFIVLILLFDLKSSSENVQKSSCSQILNQNSASGHPFSIDELM